MKDYLDDIQSIFYCSSFSCFVAFAVAIGHLHPEKIQGEYNFGNFDNLKINDTEFKCMFKSIQDMI